MVPPQPSVQLQARDFALLQGLFECRIMTVRHMSAIYFDGHLEGARKRVRRLKDAGYINVRSRHRNEGAIYSIAHRAFDTLVQQGKLNDYPKTSWRMAARRARVAALTLQHELSVNDVKAAFFTAIRSRTTLRVMEFSTWPRLFEFNTFHPATHAKIVVKPDGFIRVDETKVDGSTSEHRFFLEVDRSTETLTILTNRILGYLSYYKRGGLAEKFGRRAEEYKDFPFRVLIVCQSEKRRDNVIAHLRAAHPRVKGLVWLSASTDVLPTACGEVWITPRISEGSKRWRLFDVA